MAFIYGSLSGAILVTLATVALVLAPPAPPSVAEFAPNPATNIEDAPASQSSRFGAGEGACAVGQTGCEVVEAAAATTTTVRPSSTAGAPPPVVRARVRRCVGDPPRQIEDPQSPACVNYWEGDNGGATWQGVTRDEIRVAYPRYPGNAREVIDLWVEFFNRRFEFYGRKIRLVRYTPPGGTPVSAQFSAQDQRAIAEAADEADAFASVFPRDAGYGQDLYSELASRRIIGVESRPMSLTEDDLRRWHPYVWMYPPALDTFEANQAEWICRGLARRRARFGGPDVASSTRAFAIVVQRDPAYGPSGVPNVDTLSEGLRRCGAAPVRVVEVATSSSAAGRGADEAAMADLRTAGATSITCYCDNNRLGSLQGAAAKGAYQPEWLLVPFWGQDSDLSAQVVQGQWPEQRSHTFGLTVRNRPNENSATPWFWAAREVDPSYDFSRGTTTGRDTLFGLYQQMLLLASGIQGAGPNLTPQTFAAGLARTTFPNPGAGAPPYFQAAVGFPGGEHAMQQDVAAIWFSEGEESYDTAQRGAYCYVGGGRRWAAGGWPDDELPFFDRLQPCR
ncbi:MAG: hypothetical protein QOK43_1837 [Acidimicrobiaceae bacterium]|nr:hypothetical protein [Acidimicrobiaceae bacterium]